MQLELLSLVCSYKRSVDRNMGLWDTSMETPGSSIEGRLPTHAAIRTGRMLLHTDAAAVQMLLLCDRWTPRIWHMLAAIFLHFDAVRMVWRCI